MILSGRPLKRTPWDDEFCLLGDFNHFLGFAPFAAMFRIQRADWVIRPLLRYCVVFESWLHLNCWYRREASAFCSLMASVMGQHVPMVTVEDVPIFLSTALLALGGCATFPVPPFLSPEQLQVTVGPQS